jgi:hypothetical protein
MSFGSPTLSEALQQSIQDIHPATVAFMFFDRRSTEPLVLTEDHIAQMQNDQEELDNLGYIYPYETTSDAEVFQAYERRILDTDELQTEQEFRDSILVNILVDLVIDVDIDTFSALRYRYSGPWDDDSEWNQRDYENSDFDDDENYHAYKNSDFDGTDDLPPSIQAKEGEDTCYVCMDNIPDAMFPDCGHTWICGPCANQIVTSTQTCPLCRRRVASFRAID